MTTSFPPRVQPVHGQDLTARDLRALTEPLDHHLAHHVTGLHRTWGVSLGFEVTAGYRSGPVTIGPGIAHDRCGRMLVSRGVVAVPRPDASIVVAIRAAGRCAGGVPAIEWRLLDGVGLLDPGDDIPLAILLPDDKGSTTDVDLTIRHHTRPSAPPMVATGTVPVGGVAASGTTASWSSHVAVGRRKELPAPPEWMVSVTSLDHPTATTTVELAEPTVEGFTLHVRHSFPPGTSSFGATPVSANPSELRWVAVLGAPPMAVDPADPADPEETHP